MNVTDEQLEQARELGREAGRAAGSWAADGNTSAERARKVLGMLADGDPESESHLPAYPNLSGAWADDPTPQTVAVGVLGDLLDATGEDIDALASAWEEGVSETFESTCAAELRKALGIIGTVRLLDVRYTIEDDGRGGSDRVPCEIDGHGVIVPHGDEMIECETVEDAARAIRDHGATQWVGRWWSDPDGSQTVDYGTGEQSECSAHPDGFTDAQLDEIMALVSA